MRSRLDPESANQQGRPIRLAIVIHSMMRGGAERQICELLRGIDRSRFNPLLIVFNSIESGYPVDTFTECRTLLSRDPAKASFLRRAILLMSAVYQLTRVFREFKSEVVHAFLPVPSSISALACSILRVPVFVVGRRNMLSYHRRGRRLLELADRFPMQFATAVVGNCAAITNELVAVDHFPEDRSFTIYNGIDTERFRPGCNLKLRSELGFHPSDFVFGIVANFHPRKRHIDFVRAAKAVSERFSQAKFLMIGEDQGALAETREYLEAHSLMDRCVILEGTTTPEKYYASMNCYVSTSEVEGLSNAILEAMASGLPAIVTNVGGSAEIVLHGESGFLVSPYAPEEIAQKACLLMEDGDLCTRMGRCGRAFAESSFSLSKMVEAHESLYASLFAQQISLRQ